ncbi:MAG: hypothetical protein R2911_02160 [Caldilineaceae bacterium]
MMELLRKYRLPRMAAFLLIATLCTGLLAACVQNTAPATLSNAAEAPADDTAETVALRAAPAAITEDFTLIGQTGRPQFLNSFADW